MGVTVLCSNVLIGGMGTFYGATCTKRDKAVFFSLNHSSLSLLETMCKSGVDVGVCTFVNWVTAYGPQNARGHDNI